MTFTFKEKRLDVFAYSRCFPSPGVLETSGTCRPADLQEHWCRCHESKILFHVKVVPFVKSCKSSTRWTKDLNKSLRKSKTVSSTKIRRDLDSSPSGESGRTSEVDQGQGWKLQADA